MNRSCIAGREQNHHHAARDQGERVERDRDESEAGEGDDDAEGLNNYADDGAEVVEDGEEEEAHRCVGLLRGESAEGIGRGCGDRGGGFLFGRSDGGGGRGGGLGFLHAEEVGEAGEVFHDRGGDARTA
jgi:hypothetical protein